MTMHVTLAFKTVAVSCIQIGRVFSKSRVVTTCTVNYKYFCHLENTIFELMIAFWLTNAMETRIQKYNLA